MCGGRLHLGSGPCWLRLTYVTPVLITRLRMDTPGQRPAPQLRCVELHTVGVGGALPERKHYGAPPPPPTPLLTPVRCAHLSICVCAV
jgi:hypothetical protein